MEEILEKYSNTTLNNLNEDNIKKVIAFLIEKKCDYIEDLLEDYLDLFTIEYDVFVKKYNELDNKYNNNLLELASEDMNILEEFFND